MLNTLVSIVIPIFILMDYIGAIPVFIALTGKFTKRERTRIAIVSSLIASGIVLAFTLIGQQMMIYFGFSIPAIKVGGGLLLMYMAFEMIYSGKLAYNNVDNTHIAVSPLAIPLLAGPGSMSFAIITFIELPGGQKWLVPLAIVLACLVGGLTLAISSTLHRFLGNEFVRILEKVTAVLSAVIAAEMILDGIKQYFF